MGGPTTKSLALDAEGWTSFVEPWERTTRIEMSTVIHSDTTVELPIAPAIDIGNVRVDPPVLQAPMAGFTNYAYRQMVRDYGGVGLQATEFISARGFAWLEEELNQMPDRLWGVRDEPRPLAVQIWDNDPETLARVALLLVNDYKVSVVDLNFGCPVKQVSEKAHSGSYLLRNPERVGKIVARVVQACSPTPVTAKIRLGCSPDQITAFEVARAVEEAGAAALTVHGRTAQQYFKGNADWDTIAEIKSHLRNIPLIGNGDLDSAEKVLHVFRNYGVDGVMIARASLGRPWLFRQIFQAIRGEPVMEDPTMREQQECMLLHFGRVVERFGEEKGVMLMRKYACCYAQGRPGARAFRTHVAHVTSAGQFYDTVDRFFPSGD